MTNYRVLMFWPSITEIKDEICFEKYDRKGIQASEKIGTLDSLVVRFVIKN